MTLLRRVAAKLGLVLLIASATALACSDTADDPTAPTSTSIAGSGQVATLTPTLTATPAATATATSPAPRATDAAGGAGMTAAATAEIAASPTATTAMAASLTPTVVQPTTGPAVTATPAFPEAVIRRPRPIEGERGGRLRFAIPTTPPHQDVHESVSPILARWGPGLAYSRIFRHQWDPVEPQVGFDPVGYRFDAMSASSAGDILCDICESWHMDAADVLVVQLRDDVAWHNVAPTNGRRLVAEDVAFSLNRVRDPAFPNRDLLNTVRSVTATDDRTVVIETVLPDAELFEKLADAGAAIVAPESVAVHGNLRTGPTSGTGPWILGRYEPILLTFSANLDYFNPELPLSFGLEASVVEEPETRFVMMRVDASDFAQIGVENLMTLAERNAETPWNTELDAATGIEFALNTKQPPFDDVRVRRAVLQAWFENNDYAGRGAQFAYPSAGLPLRDPSWLLPTAEVTEYFATLPSGSVSEDRGSATRGEVTIKVGEFGDAYREAALDLAFALRTVGFLPLIEAVSTREFADDVWIGGNYTAYVGAPPPQSSTSGLLFSLHHSAGPWNSTGYQSAELDDLITRQTVELYPEVRRELLREIQREIFAASHRFIAYANVPIWTWSASVQSFSPNTFRGGTHWLSRIWLRQ